VRVFYLTNRLVELREPTLKNLRTQGLPVDADGRNILFTGELPPGADQPWEADKASRRAYLVRRFRILLLIGDQLGDFLPGTDDDPAARVALAREHASCWGLKWFALPNPCYGGWEDVITHPRERPSDEAALARKFAALKVWDDAGSR
jgi:acid phosphatase